MSLDNAIAIGISGLVLGSLYALMASGLSLVWGTLRIFNFAHGAMLALGAYFAWTITSSIEGIAGLAAGMLFALSMAAVVGVIMERLLVRPFVSKSGGDLIAMVTTLAAATLIQNLIQIGWGPRLKQLPQVADGFVTVGGTTITYHDVFVIAAAPVVLLVLRLFLDRAKLGMAIRAVEQNRDNARLVGIDVPRIYALTFAIAAMLAALAGVLLGGIFFMTPTMGDDPLLRAFVVVVLGGLASLGGTVIAAYFIGLLQAASVFFLGLFVTPAVLYGVMIAVLLIRPQGLFGRTD